MEKNGLETCVIELQVASPLSQRHSHTRQQGRHLRGHAALAHTPCARLRREGAGTAAPSPTARSRPGVVPRAVPVTRRDAGPSPASSPSPPAPTTLCAAHGEAPTYLLIYFWGKKTHTHIYIYMLKIRSVMSTG